MKKILIAVGALGVMSFTTNQLMNTYQISVALDNIQDMREWMKEDINAGIIEEVYGEYYIEMLGETEWRLIEFCESNRITKVRNRDYTVNEDGSITVIK